MKFRYLLFALTFILILSLFYGCALFRKIDVDIVSLGWVVENIDHSFWSSYVDATCFHNFWIYYEGDDIDVDDIEYARVYFNNDDYYWDIPIDKSSVSNGCIGKWYRFWTKNYSFNQQFSFWAGLRNICKDLYSLAIE